MPISIHQAAEANAATAADKANAYRDPARSALAGVLAGAFVGLAIVLLMSVSAPLAAASHPFTKLVQAAVFGLALTLVVFAGAELFTGNTMVMVQGLFARRTTWRDLGVVWGRVARRQRRRLDRPRRDGARRWDHHGRVR